MKSAGIIRKVDGLGHVAIPKKDSVEFFVDEDQIILKKYTPYNE